MKVPAALSREIIASLVDEEIRKVKGGYKVYPKKPQKGRKTRRAQMWKRRYNSSLGAGAVDHYLRKNNEN